MTVRVTGRVKDKVRVRVRGRVEEKVKVRVRGPGKGIHLPSGKTFSFLNIIVF